MKLEQRHIAKADSRLQDALTRAQGGELLRTIMILGPTGPSDESSVESPPRAADFPSREAWREALVARRQDTLAREIGGTIKALRDLSLKPSGGTTGRTVIVEGPADKIWKSLDLPGVQRAVLDSPIGLTEPTSRTPDDGDGPRGLLNLRARSGT